MDLSPKIQLNNKLYIRNPEESELGRNIVSHGVLLIDGMGFEAFTFKKLATEINTTEAGIYRYFENKHLLLLYIVDWYWTWMEYRLVFHTHNATSAEMKIKTAIVLLSGNLEDGINASHIDKKKLYNIIMSEGAKSYLTKQVNTYNKAKLFKPYKDLCARIAGFITEYNPSYKFSHSLATTIIEMAHSQKFYMHHLPSLTDFGEDKNDKRLIQFLESMVFDAIRKHKK